MSKTITYQYKGIIERWSKRGAVFHDGYAAVGENVGVQFPWRTQREARADARRRGARAVFVREAA